MTVDEQIGVEATAPVEAPASGAPVPMTQTPGGDAGETAAAPTTGELQNLLYEVEAKLRAAGHWCEAEFDAIRAKL